MVVADANELAYYGVGEFVPYEFPAQFSGLMIVCEAPGADEVKIGRPLVGQAGQLLDSILASTNWSRSGLVIANTFRHRPDKNKVDNFFVSAQRARQQNVAVGNFPPWRGKLVRELFAVEIKVLRATIRAWVPKVIIPMGSVACWSVLGMDQVTKLQGTTHWKRIGEHACAVLPTFHPASALPGRSPQNRDAIQVTFQTAQQLVRK